LTRAKSRTAISEWPLDEGLLDLVARLLVGAGEFGPRKADRALLRPRDARRIAPGDERPEVDRADEGPRRLATLEDAFERGHALLDADTGVEGLEEELLRRGEGRLHVGGTQVDALPLLVPRRHRREARRASSEWIEVPGRLRTWEKTRCGIGPRTRTRS
jgi:hypothetical protein